MATQDQYPQRYVIGGQCRNESGAYVQTITLTAQRDTTDNGRFYDGRWYREERDGENRREIVNTSSFGEKVFFRFRFKGKVEGFGAPESTVIIQNTNQIRVQMFEYDPTIFDGDELIGDTEPEQRNGTEIHPRNQLRVRKITIGSRRNPDPNPDPLLEVEVDLNDTCFVRGRDSGESEFYCKISAPVNNGRTLEKELPEDTHYYLKVRYHLEYVTIRVQVLDCRSGRPIPNARVKKIALDGGSGNRRNEFFFKPDLGRIDVNGYTIATIRTALNRYFNNEACGNGHKKYSCTQQTSSFNNAEKETYANFLKDRWYFFDAAHPNAENNGPIPALRANENEPPHVMRRYIVDEYNGMCSTDENGFLLIRVPLNKYLRDMGRNRGLELKLAIRFWEVPVFVERLNSGSSSNTIRRDNFYLVASGAPESGTGFNIKWPVIIQGNGQRNLTAEANQQSNEDNRGFGWRAVKGTGSSALEVEFKTSVELKINTDKYNFENFDFESITHCNGDFSTFYRNEDLRPYASEQLKDPHFVLFAMQWCQPVWDGIDDPNGFDMINNTSYTIRERKITSPADRRRTLDDCYTFGRNMHIVTNTTHRADWISAYTKFYGTWYSNREGNTANSGGIHQGLDVHARTGDLLFAIHGGSVAESSYKLVNVTWRAFNEIHRLNYLHINRHEIENAGPARRVQAGKIIGYGGRTGNIDPTPPNPKSGLPSHVHLYYERGVLNNYPNQVFRQLKELRTSIYGSVVDKQYDVCIPFDDFPLLFPCACECVNIPENANANNCNFIKTQIASRCWAVFELKCPFMNSTQGNDETIQLRFRMNIEAKLNYLCRKNTTTPNPYRIAGGRNTVPLPDDYHNEILLNGDWGSVPATQTVANANTNNTTRKAINAFRKHHHTVTTPLIFSTQDHYDSRDYNVTRNDAGFINLLNTLCDYHQYD